MKTRILSLLLCFALCLSLLTGCSSSTNTADSSTSPDVVADSSAIPVFPAEAREDAVKYTTDGAFTSDTVVMTVNGIDIPASYYLYWVAYYDMYLRNYYSYYMGVTLTPSTPMDDKGTTFAQTVVEQSEDRIICYHAVQALCADKNITLTEEQKSELANYMEQQSANPDALTAVCTTAEEQGKIYEQYQLAMNLKEAMFGDNGEQTVTDATLQDYAKEQEVYNCRYILCPVEETTSEDGSEVTDNSAEQQAKCKQIYEELSKLKGEQQLEAFKEYQKGNPDGNTNEFQYDKTQTMTEGFKEAVAALKVGELGMTGKTGYGYFVVLRLDPNMADIKDAYITERFSSELDELIHTATVERTGALDKLDLESFLSKTQALQAAVQD